MKLNKARFFLSVIIFSIVLFISISLLFISREERGKPLSAYFSIRCIDYKQQEFNRKLNDKIVDYLEAAKLKGITPCKDDNDLRKRISEGRLVKVSSGKSYIIEKMTFSYPFITGESKMLLDEIARRFSEKCAQNGLNGVKFYVTSMTRRIDNVKSLRRHNGNASQNSPHLFGNTFDLSYKRFVARKWVLTNCDKKFLKEALAEVIWQLRTENRCWATHEKMQSCYHVVAR
jgi:Family of unknown function (DUF5715)